MTNFKITYFKQWALIAAILIALLVLLPVAVFAESDTANTTDTASDSSTADGVDIAGSAESSSPPTSTDSTSSDPAPESPASESSSPDSEITSTEPEGSQTPLDNSSEDLSADEDSTECSSLPESNTSLDSYPDTTSTEALASESDDDLADEPSLIQSNEEQSNDESETGLDGDCYVVELDVLDIVDVNTEIDLQFTFSEVGDSSIGEIDIEIPDVFTYVDNGVTINDFYATNWTGSYNSGTVTVSRNDTEVSAIFKDNYPINILFSVFTPASAGDDHEFTTSVKDADGNNNDMDTSSSQPLVNVRDGSAELPFEIGNAYQLDDVRNYLNDKHFIQTADIDLGVDGWADGEGWEPLGDNSTKFSGNFDGAGYEISNLTINRPTTNYQGLFGFTNNAEISHMNLVNVKVQGSLNTGSLIGKAVNTAIENVHATGEITGNGYGYTGGLVGFLSGNNICNSSFNGAVSGQSYTGGLVGWSDQHAKIYYSYSLGSVKGTDAVGGLVGYQYRGDTSILDSNSHSSIEGNYRVGGLVGYNDGTPSSGFSSIYRSYSTGLVNAPVGALSVGGLLGYKPNDSAVEDCYWDIQTSGQATSSGGTGKTTDEMMQRETYTNWDFDSDLAVWNIVEGAGYPNLVQTSRSIALTPAVQLHGDAETAGNNIHIISNTDWIANSNQGWIIISGDSAGSNNGVVIYNLGANSSTDPREGSITVSGSGIERTFTINQLGIVAVSYTVTYTAEVGGLINGQAEIVEQVSHGSDGPTVNAQPDVANGYEFTGWSDGLETAVRQDTNVTAEITVSAIFALRQYEITVSADPEAGGTVTGGGTYTHGDTVTVIATADETDGYDFVSWAGDDSTDTTIIFTAESARSLTANFALRQYIITVAANPAAGGTVTGGGTYTHGDQVTVTATAEGGYVFSNWTESDVAVSTEDVFAFSAEADRNLIAGFGEEEDNDPGIDPDPEPSTNLTDNVPFELPFLILAQPSTARSGGVIFGVTPLINPWFAQSGSAEKLAAAEAVYQQLMQSFESNNDNLSAREYAWQQVELAVTLASIRALEAALAAQTGQGYNLSAAISAYQTALNLVTANASQLTGYQRAYALLVLSTIAGAINDLGGSI